MQVLTEKFSLVPPLIYFINGSCVFRTLCKSLIRELLLVLLYILIKLLVTPSLLPLSVTRCIGHRVNTLGKKGQRVDTLGKKSHRVDTLGK